MVDEGTYKRTKGKCYTVVMRRNTILSLLIVIALAAGGWYLWRNKSSPAPVPSTSETATPSEQALTFFAPEGPDDYTAAMNEYTSRGGENPAKTWPFVAMPVTEPISSDPLLATAQAAAGYLPSGGGPAHASVVYLKVQENTAYVVLDIDLDGWAGVSFSVNRIRPLIEQSLLQFPDVQQVVFEFAPGDNAEDIH